MTATEQENPGLKGEVAYFYAYDVAYELRRPGLHTILGHPLVTHQIGLSKRTPRQRLFYQARMACLDPATLPDPNGGTVLVERTIKVLPIGAISITLRVPFVVPTVEALSQFHRTRVLGGELHRHAQALAAQIYAELAPVSVRPVPRLAEEEAYTVFCIEPPAGPGAAPEPAATTGAGEGEGEGTGPPGPGFNAEHWFRLHRRRIAALITEETGGPPLSTQEAMESTSKHLSYYQSDLIVVDWDAALIVDRKEDYEGALLVMELANLQLEELEAYDQIMDAALEKSYTDLLRPPRLRERRHLLPHLREVRIDLARFSDELSNITKFFGDWHLARLYDTVSRRFHLPDWHRSIDEKLKTLDDLYEMLKQEQNHRLMVFLEAAIVIMFVIDIIFLLAELLK